ncbi:MULTISPECIES: Na+/H+ antiporter subunit E [Pseudomonas]|uniref:Putative monovalent cation/H+ antiporter subunit E n=3 Tax=Pseudomonas syringae group TaxID=136849 RepID=A0A3M4IXC3_PSEVI|nr:MULTISPECIES: Na+/H+ antiporter subunit E [Pseudomonas]KTB71397.1 cation:proton antiporter [Pseudomonas sp. ICMP 3272]KTC51939.1 cation:proton antiporter [Pseudomonas syringae ICMP 19498]MCJ2373439.1 Na+/H+ antiporter subunit E [Pseudomonas sp. RGM 3321]RMO99859.1 putative monovalent cation/H+ antiporter subunit E [Pseudomonas syringae pv. persicae]RMP80464.1 putative monovalent cation/H+ antiporter subunit E [Pseudomonas syringae pv. actinidiae]
MKRLFPAPLLSLALWLLWLVLNLSISPGHLLLGAVLGFLAPLLMAPLRPLPVRIRKPGTILKFLCMVGWDVVVSNLQVGLSVWRLEGRPPRSAFVRIPLDLHDAHGLAALAMVTTVVPGTVWSELALDRSVLLMHVFDLEDEAQFIEHFKTTYERPLMEIFQ